MQWHVTMDFFLCLVAQQDEKKKIFPDGVWFLFYVSWCYFVTMGVIVTVGVAVGV